ncbi:MAG: SPOR domain-containing protein [Candidatus Omnitrophota bacterium]
MKRRSSIVLQAVALSIFFSGPCFAQSSMFYGIEKLMLKDDYQLAAQACERILSSNYRSTTKVKAHYLLGLCLLKQSKFESAREQFDTVLRGFSTSPYGDDASLSIAHSYFLDGNCSQAATNYNQFLIDYPRSELTSVARAYLDRCVKGEPALDTTAPGPVDDSGQDYTVQVGCFSNRTNALRLRDKVLSAGFEGYIQELPSDNLYHVRVGHFSNRLDAEFLEQKLKTKGYSTKVCP